MTTIIGVQGDGFAVICSDSRVSTFGDNFSQIGTLREGSSKVSQNGKYLIGAAGDVRAINILQHVFQPPAPPINANKKTLDQFFTAKFIPALRESVLNLKVMLFLNEKTKNTLQNKALRS